MSSSFVDYEYTRPWPIYALGFKNSDINIKGKPHAAIAVGSFLKELENRVDIVAVPKEKQTGGERWKTQAPVSVCSFAHPYPPAKILWSPDPSSSLLATIGFNLRLYSFDGSAVRQEFGFRTDQACLSCDWHVETGTHGQIVTCGTGGPNCRGSNLVVWDIDLTAQAAEQLQGAVAEGQQQQAAEVKVFQLPAEHPLASLDIYDVAFIPGTRGEQVLCACREQGSLEQRSSIWRVFVRAESLPESVKLWESDEARITGIRWCPAVSPSPDFPHHTFGFLTTQLDTGAPEAHVQCNGGRHALEPHIEAVRLPESSRTLAWWPWLETPTAGLDIAPVFRCCTFSEGTASSAGQLAIWRVQEGDQVRKEFEMALPGGDKDAPKGSDSVSSLQWSRHPSPHETDLVALAFTYRLQIINLKTD